MRSGKILSKAKVEAIFRQRRKELLTKLARLRERKKEGWRYKRVYRKRHKVPEHWVTGHYAMLPVKRK